MFQVLSFKFQEDQSGQLLLEVLITISVSAIVVGMAAGLITVSLRAVKSSEQRTIATKLLQEEIEIAGAVARAKWRDIYDRNKGSGNQYYPSRSGSAVCTDSGTKWCFVAPLVAGDMDVIIEGATFSRYVYFENVCRGDSSREITGVSPCGFGSSDDPSTQKITAGVAFGQGETISRSRYLARWPNEACNQTQWTASGQTTPTTCPATGYDTATNIATGASLQLQP